MGLCCKQPFLINPGMQTFSRFRFFSSKQPISLLHRFGPSRRIQSHSYNKSTGPTYGKRAPLVTVATQAPRLRLGAWSWTIPIAMFAGFASLVYYNDQRRGFQNVGGNKCGVDDKGIGGPFTLIDSDNRVVTEQEFLGNWYLFYFGYTFSPDVGPEQVQVMAKAIDILEKKKNHKVFPVFVTIDPQRDTPSHLRAYLKEFDSRIVGLTGPVGAVRQMAQEYRVFFRKVEEEGDDYLVECSNYMHCIPLGEITL
ncbi:protein SCO1 homolog 2, mitochondrial isoform X2 [Ricinus communis]|uniref:protein SCO1 homolog 2, mitochondrial isoform X2 n=1 Tax=Ricinus communis TaxID=3988 RepID=UPI00201B24E3|nr:protein SCO1 homolog 2, mitochondrial isoform X2 [Ricinus communis]